MVFRTAERQRSGDTHNTQKSAEKARNEHTMLPPSLHAMQMFQIGIISKFDDDGTLPGPRAKFDDDWISESIMMEGP